MIKIELAKIEDLQRVKTIAEACAADMISKNIFQWNEKYPSRDVFKNDIINNSLYISKQGDVITGCIVISTKKDQVYKNIDWLSKDYMNIYIHRLAVHPNYQKKGIGKTLMTFAEEYARINDFKSIRLDTFSKNIRNNKFYKSRNYNQLGNVFFPMQSEYPFHCYEKIID